MKTDRGETSNLAQEYPAKVDALLAEWREYKARVNFAVPAKLPPNPNSALKWQTNRGCINKQVLFRLELNCRLVTQCQPPRRNW